MQNKHHNSNEQSPTPLQFPQIIQKVKNLIQYPVVRSGISAINFAFLRALFAILWLGVRPGPGARVRIPRMPPALLLTLFRNLARFIRLRQPDDELDLFLLALVVVIIEFRLRQRTRMIRVPSGGSPTAGIGRRGLWRGGERKRVLGRTAFLLLCLHLRCCYCCCCWYLTHCFGLRTKRERKRERGAFFFVIFPLSFLVQLLLLLNCFFQYITYDAVWFYFSPHDFKAVQFGPLISSLGVLYQCQ